MPSTHTSLHYHVVFSTKNRESTIGSQVRADLHAYLGGIVRGMKGVAYAAGGTNDHVHVFMGLKATHCLADVMRELKADSSKWLKTEKGVHSFSWQEGYGAFTVSAPDLAKVKRYVQNQEEHHRVKTFKEEYVAMLERGLVEYDDKYLW